MHSFNSIFLMYLWFYINVTIDNSFFALMTVKNSSYTNIKVNLMFLFE